MNLQWYIYGCHYKQELQSNCFIILCFFAAPVDHLLKMHLDSAESHCWYF